MVNRFRSGGLSQTVRPSGVFRGGIPRPQQQSNNQGAVQQSQIRSRIEQLRAERENIIRQQSENNPEGGAIRSRPLATRLQNRLKGVEAELSFYSQASEQLQSGQYYTDFSQVESQARTVRSKATATRTVVDTNAPTSTSRKPSVAESKNYFTFTDASGRTIFFTKGGEQFGSREGIPVSSSSQVESIRQQAKVDADISSGKVLGYSGIGLSMQQFNTRQALISSGIVREQSGRNIITVQPLYDSYTTGGNAKININAPAYYDTRIAKPSEKPSWYSESGKTTGQIIKQRFKQVGIGISQKAFTITEAGLSYFTTFGGGKITSGVDISFLGSGKSNVNLSNIKLFGIGSRIQKIKDIEITPTASRLSAGFVYTPLVVPAVISSASAISKSFSSVSTIPWKTFVGESLQSFSVVNPRGGVFLYRDSTGKPLITNDKLVISSKGILDSRLPTSISRTVTVKRATQETLKLPDTVKEPTVSSTATLKSGYVTGISVRPTGLGYVAGDINLPIREYQAINFIGYVRGKSFRGRRNILTARDELVFTDAYTVNTQLISGSRYEKVFGKVSTRISRETIQGGKIRSFVDVPSQEQNVVTTLTKIKFVPEPYRDFTKSGLLDQVTILRPYTRTFKSRSIILDPYDVKGFKFAGKFVSQKAIIEPSVSLTKLGRIGSFSKRIIVGRELGDDKTFSQPFVVTQPKDLSVGGSPFDGKDFSNVASPLKSLVGLGENLIPSFNNQRANLVFADEVLSYPPSFNVPSRIRGNVIVTGITGTKSTVRSSTKQRRNVITTPSSFVVQKSNQEVFNVPATRTRQAQTSITSQRTNQASLLDSISTTKQVSLQRPLQKQINVTIPVKTSIINTPNNPPRTPIKIPSLKLKGGGSPLKNIFSVQVRRQGKFRTIGVGDFGKVFDIGRKRVSTTLGATFKVTGSGKLPSTPKGFYRKGNLFIEKRKYRLSTSSELKEIQTYKRKRRIKK